MYSLTRRPHGFFTIFSQPSTLMLLCSTRNSWFGHTHVPNKIKNPKTKPRKIHKNPMTFPKSSPHDPPKQRAAPKLSRIEYTKKLFDEPDLGEVVNMFKELTKFKWFRGSRTIYNIIIRRLAAKKKNSWIEEIIETQKQTKRIRKEGFCMRFIRLYGESHMFSHAQNLFNEMPQLNSHRTVRSLNALMNAAFMSEKFPEVVELFSNSFKELKIIPDAISYNILLKALGRLGSLDDLVPKIYEMERAALKPDRVCFCTVLRAFYMNGRFSDGDNVWKMMEDRCIPPSIECFTAKLSGLTFKRRMPAAVECYNSLIKEGLSPDNITFNALILGFCVCGNSEQAKKWYNEMRNRKCRPNKATFHTLIHLACGNNDLEWGLELCNVAFSFRCRINPSALQSLVDALIKKSMIREAKWLVELFKPLGHPYHSAPKLGSRE